MIPYLVMAFLYLAVVVLAATGVSLTSAGALTAFAGLPWLRVHVITLGVVTQTLFGLLPRLAASRAGAPRPRFRPDIWLALNAGMVTLLVGIPLVRPALIVAGGALVFAATALLVARVAVLRPPPVPASTGPSRAFYVAGAAFLLVGIVVGTGLWLGWSSPLRIQVPLEVHIHANNWGFLSLVFAGLLLDLVPALSGRPLLGRRAARVLLAMMSAGAVGLVVGPWAKVNVILVPGLLLHLAATVWLVVAAARGLRGVTGASSAGVLHLLTAYLWLLAPVVVAPLILLGVPGFPGAGIEQGAPQALVYGWVLQIAYAVVPFAARRTLEPGEAPRLGGNRVSLVAAHLGSALLWASIFGGSAAAGLLAAAYALWGLSAVPVVVEVGAVIVRALARLEPPAPA